MEILKDGQEYFFGVLGGGIRTAQKLVVQKTRYYHDQKTAQEQAKRFVNMRQGGLTFEEKMERGLMVCGTPDMAIEQIHTVHKELGNARIGLSVKIGNVPDAHVTRTLDYLRDEVFPATRHLGEEEAQAAQ